MSDKPARRTAPMWVFVVTFLAVALIAGGAGWLLAGPKPAPPVVTPPVATSTVETSTTIPPETTPTIEPTTTVPATVRESSLITDVKWSASKGYRISVDYVQILTGKAAADAATAAGEESPPPNDYFILNASFKVRTFSLPKTTPVTVLGWAGADATAKKKITVGQLMDIMASGNDPQDDYMHSYFYVTVKAGTTVTKVEQIYFP